MSWTSFDVILKGNKGGEAVIKKPTNCHLKLERLCLLSLKEKGEEMLFAGQGGMADAAQTEQSKTEDST